MIALLATYLLIFYVLIPGVLFRFPASWFLKLKIFQLTRTQEATFAVFVGIVPFLVALALVWYVPAIDRFVYGSEWSAPERSSDYQLAAAVVLTPDASKLFGKDQKSLAPGYLQAVNAVVRHQGRFLCWFYLFAVAEGTAFGLMAVRYGDWRGKSGLYDLFTRKVIVPNISEWQTLLTDFTWPKTPKRSVYVDVLTKEAGLYQGRVANFFLDLSGRLSGLQMEQVRRFRKGDYEASLERDRAEQKNRGARVIDETESISREDFWTTIPGTNFYVPADQILNLNIRFPFAKESDLQAAVQRELPELLEGSSPDAVALDADITIQEEDD
ncbi:hypothetical protein ACPOL_2137 [Acidisarcina polymorpha]|uniref:Uncharacterized protein n=1 Tax=Acidisarcina polymorpha TaxID=2211140 RepID=A0A2Z5FX87_9BACT|nr:hypothetical protein [Acidisarcina polymorpha]AXC11461.1 hypothetical protein ACPOL_2137 [Acidisarcina polymorpha]